MKKIVAIVNAVFLILVLAVNYLSQAGRLNDTTIGEVSDKYATLFTPADYAFSIWGLIYLSLFFLVGYQVYRAFISVKNTHSIQQVGFWLALTNALNCVWVFLFMFEHIGLAAIVMAIMFLCLLKIIGNTRMERWDAPVDVIAFVWWPICLYSGWLAVALISNVAAYLVKIDWDGWSISDQWWTVIMLAVAVSVNLVIIWKRNMREFAMVGIWALFAIFVRHFKQVDLLAYTALVGVGVLLVNVAVHGYLNRHTNPFSKLRQRLSDRPQ